MMPLPLLQVKEAAFDIELNVNLVNLEEKSTMRSEAADAAAAMPDATRLDATTVSRPLSSDMGRTIGVSLRMPKKIERTVVGQRSIRSSAVDLKRKEIRTTLDEYRNNRRGLTAKQHEQRADTCARLRRELENLIQEAKRKASVTSVRLPSTVQSTGSRLVISTSKSESSSTTHVRVKIKMEQHPLPDGIHSLLQAAANGLTVKHIPNA